VSHKHINFRIGVTGHRDIQPGDFESLHQQSVEFLTRLQANLPGTEISVISGMAEGADRIFRSLPYGGKGSDKKRQHDGEKIVHLSFLLVLLKGCLDLAGSMLLASSMRFTTSSAVMQERLSKNARMYPN
jgi:hypothetical protein